MKSSVIGLVFMFVAVAAVLFFGLSVNQDMVDMGEENINNSSSTYDNFEHATNVTDTGFEFGGYVLLVIAAVMVISALVLLVSVTK